MKEWIIHKFEDEKCALLTYHRKFEQERFFDVDDLHLSIVNRKDVKHVLIERSLDKIFLKIIRDNKYFFSADVVYALWNYCDWLKQDDDLLIGLEVRFLNQFRKKNFSERAPFIVEFLNFVMDHYETALFLEDHYNVKLVKFSTDNKLVCYRFYDTSRKQGNDFSIRIQFINPAIVDQLAPKHQEIIKVKELNAETNRIKQYADDNFCRIFKRRNLSSYININYQSLLFYRKLEDVQQLCCTWAQFYLIGQKMLINQIRICKDELLITNINTSIRPYRQIYSMIEVDLTLNEKLNKEEQLNFLNQYAYQIRDLFILAAQSKRMCCRCCVVDHCFSKYLKEKVYKIVFKKYNEISCWFKIEGYRPWFSFR